MDTNEGTADALSSPLLLLPFRPDSDPSSARSFITNFYKHNAEGSHQYRGQGLQQELRLAEPIALCSIMKWCWSRMPGGVVTWPVYEGLKIGEKESHEARNAFQTFVPMTADSEARTNIIYDFFDLLAAVAAHGKMNGLGGRKLSRLAGWWAFAHEDDGNGFEGGYKQWSQAADASSHLFFAYLRSLSPEADPSKSVISRIPRSLQALLAQTEYPPETPALLQRTTPRVVMLVDSVSPTPFALLRRAKHFEYGNNDHVLKQFSEFEDPVNALTDECKRVLMAVSSVNTKTALSRQGNFQTDESWSTFQSLGFSDMTENTKKDQQNGMINGSPKTSGQGLRSAPRSRATDDHGRPTTPSWADFLSQGFAEDEMPNKPPALLLPFDKQLPPIGSRTQTPDTLHNRDNEDLAPGELAAVTSVELDDAFWWVWMTSLASEEHNDRKGVFGRCALIETTIMNGKWLIMEEQIKGASPEPAENVQFVEKKSRFAFTKRGRLGRKRSIEKKPQPQPHGAREQNAPGMQSKVSLGAEQHAKIKAAAAELASKESVPDTDAATRRGRYEDACSTKTNSVLTMGMKNEADPAMKWAHAYDKDTIRKQYLGDNFAGRGMNRDLLTSKASSMVSKGDASSVGPMAPPSQSAVSTHSKEPAYERELPALPQEEQASQNASSATQDKEPQSPLPAPLPPKAPEVQVKSADEMEKQHQAEETALPKSTTANEVMNPLEKEIVVEQPPAPSTGNKVERKPVPRTSNLQNHPAYRQQSVDETPVSPTDTQAPAAVAAQRAAEPRTSSSPESQKQPQHLKKGGGGGGFKKLFGRKKDNSKRNSFDVGAQNNSALAPPSDSNLGRRLSMMRKKTDKSQTSQPAASPMSPQPAPETIDLLSEPASPSTPAKQDHQPLSRVDTQDKEDADHAFSRFDQGPIQDTPGAAPRDSTDAGSSLAEDEEDERPSKPLYNTLAATRLDPRGQQQQAYRNDHSPGFTTPMERGSPVTNDAESEASMEPPAVKTGGPTGKPSQDRWQQIRENAAKRAARASEEQSMQSRPSASQRTEDGETSGEESKLTTFQLERSVL